MLAAVGLAGLGAGVLVLWSALANVSPIDVVRETFDPSRAAGDRRQLASPIAPALTDSSVAARDRATVGALATVRGITVDASIAGNLRALLDQAERDGVSLSGSGYRSNARQRELYAQNCPNGVCRIPTAVPGTSMHERGLAVDFTQSGRSLTRSSSGFRWLTVNAGRYGLRNLPSEPWHWSTTGT